GVWQSYADMNTESNSDSESDQKPLTLALSRRERGLIAVFGRATPTCDSALNSDPESDQKPLTLALSQRERGLIAVFGRVPTCDAELNSDFEKPTNRPPLPRERAGVRGESTTNPKPTKLCSSPLNRMSVSSAAALDL
ncbi:hypothetical protein, partial [Pseudomonas fluorescens]|uniref:hypothetical protein n=1 Tax=Pseudomonas fluorescens TaxID=294 RepID=UPI001CA6A198